jgi:segregation and condensation protein A
MNNLLESPEVDELLSSSVNLPKISIQEKINRISHKLMDVDTVSFYSLLSGEPTLLDIIVTFLAILELMKQKWITVEQETLFGDIQLVKTSEFQAGGLVELEFGE